MTRFKQDAQAQKDLANTVKLSDMRSEGFDTIFFVGGHGPMWDIVDNPDSIALIESFYNSGKPVAAVCHSSAVYHRVMINGVPLIKGSESRVSPMAREDVHEADQCRALPCRG